MSPKKRNPENRGLPARWVLKHGAYYYLPPAHARAQWDGKTWFQLGDTLSEAYKVWSQRISAPERTHTIGALLERYQLEVIPTKAPKTQTENLRYLPNLRKAFDRVALADLEPQHVYQYIDKRTAKTAAQREIEVLSHAFTKAVQWGLIRKHPFKGEIRLDENTQPRTRYVEDWELQAAMGLISHRKKGGVAMVQAYLRLKMLTGLRQRDLLLMKIADCKDDGIHVIASKTKKTTGKAIIYEWTDALRDAIEELKAVRPALSPYLLCNKFGQCYVDEESGTANDWNNIWQRFMTRVLTETNVKERFTEHDLRAKVGSDADSAERAKQLLTHTDLRVTERVYRRKPERVKPTK